MTWAEARIWQALATGWPPVAGAVLGIAAVVEAVFRAEDSAAAISAGILLGLGATVPVAALPRYPVAVAAAVTATTALTTVPYGGPAGPSWPGLVATCMAWLVLLRGRIRLRRAEAAERDASRKVIEDTLLEFTARGERARIARELHDVVAHHISMISVQAETARVTTPGIAQETARQLTAIGETARTALTEMRRLLGVLREDAGAEPTRRPQPGLQQLIDLLDETRDSGGAGARLIVRGPVTALDPGVELAAFRIVQEALTNARRHAPGAAVDVEVAYAEESLRLTVRDNGPGPPADARPGGHGLLGMRERVASVGGRLRVGRAPVSGFLVEAELPVTRLAAAGAPE